MAEWEDTPLTREAEQDGLIVLRVGEYVEKTDCYMCLDKNGQRHEVDLLVDGGVKSPQREKLVGSVVSCKCLDPHTFCKDAYLHHQIELAGDVCLISDRKED